VATHDGVTIRFGDGDEECVFLTTDRLTVFGEDWENSKNA
jgi:hypothetical protein